MSKFDFNEVALQLYVNLLHIFRTPFYKKTSGGLLLIKPLRAQFSICLSGRLFKGVGRPFIEKVTASDRGSKRFCYD